MDANQEIIRLDGITKMFGGVKALDNVSFSINKGEVHAVVGENGAGKSTLMKMLAGVHTQDSGEVTLRGTPVRLGDPRQARMQGISIVFQELNLFPDLTVTGNIFANREVSKAGLLNERAMQSEVKRVFQMMGVDLDPHAKTRTLSVGERQLVEIARTLQQESEIIIMDEPNSALTESESARLFEIIRRLRDSGITVIYVSHRLEEVFAIADRITVLRDGHYQGTWITEKATSSEIINAMIGRYLEEGFPERTPNPDAPVLLEMQNVMIGDKIGPLSVTLRAGEILGFAGLEGAGVDEFFHLLFGLQPKTRGEILYKGKPWRANSPADAIDQHWALIPASRREHGLMMDWSIRRNATLVILHRMLTPLRLISTARERQTTMDYVQRLKIATDSIEKKVTNLSGGNQQKVVLSKWLASGPEVMILNDPTRGVDVGAKHEIYYLTNQLAKEGITILFASSELKETVGLCDRILCFRRGKIVREFARGEASKADVMRVIASADTEEPVNVNAEPA